MNRWVRLAIGIALVMLAGAVVYRAYIPHNAFDPALWQAQHGRDVPDNPRAGMVGAIEQLLSPGMTRGEVEALLGEPEQRNGESYIYDVGGSAGAAAADYAYFVVEFDPAGRVVRYELMRG
jgi:hypothetical protein